MTKAARSLAASKRELLKRQQAVGAELSLHDVLGIIKGCRANGVLSFQYKGLEVTFSQSPDTAEERVVTKLEEPSDGDVESIRREHLARAQEAYQPRLARGVPETKQSPAVDESVVGAAMVDELESLMVTNPEEYERRIFADELR